ncbi:MAG: hypothetical protein P4L48_01915 [Mycobacterium sp.]|nr:hypothetical protein [Mycobacterium sp.]HKI43081.1 hypothetical protein [Mycobacterium sp.]
MTAPNESAATEQSGYDERPSRLMQVAAGVAIVAGVVFVVAVVFFSGVIVGASRGGYGGCGRYTGQMGGGMMQPGGMMPGGMMGPTPTPTPTPAVPPTPHP